MQRSALEFSLNPAVWDVIEFGSAIFSQMLLSAARTNAGIAFFVFAATSTHNTFCEPAQNLTELRHEILPLRTPFDPWGLKLNMLVFTMSRYRINALHSFRKN